MGVPLYEDRPVDCSLKLECENLRGKSAIVTGGANGLGKAYVEALVAAGAYVSIGDLDERGGALLSEQYAGQVQFIKCNVTLWEDQLRLFKAAISSSPNKSCDIVVANAGISGPDPVWQLDDLSKDPVKPDLRILETNLVGVLYTTKLAMHYFRLQPESELHDRCLIIKASIAAYVDQPGSPQYNASKYGARALMRCMRRTAWTQGVRVNLVAPWYIRTTIMSDQVQKHVESKGVDFALLEDACKAVLRLASDKSLNGRAFGVVPRKEAPEGYMDLIHDDYQDGDFLKEWQELVLLTSHRIAVPSSVQ